MFSKGFDKRRDREALQELRAMQNKSRPIVPERPFFEFSQLTPPIPMRKQPLYRRFFGSGVTGASPAERNVPTDRDGDAGWV